MGFTTEAGKALLHRGFEELELQKIWCGYFEGNTRSKRVMEKCGFEYDSTEKDVFFHIINEKRTEHIYQMTREQWLKKMLYN